MISYLKTIFCLNNLNILRPKVTKNLTNLCEKFCEFQPWPGTQNMCYLIRDSAEDKVELPTQIR